MGAHANVVSDPVPRILHRLANVGEDGARRRRGAVLEECIVLASGGAQFVGGRALRNRDAVAVEVVLELAVAPRIKDVVLGDLGGLGEVAGQRRPLGTAGCGCRGIPRPRGADELIARGILPLGKFLRRLVSMLDKVGPQILEGHVIINPGVPTRGGLVGILPDQSAELIRLGALRNRNATGIKETLEPAVTPRVDGLVKSVLGGEGCLVRNASILVASARRGGTKGISSLLGNIVV